MLRCWEGLGGRGREAEDEMAGCPATWQIWVGVNQRPGDEPKEGHKHAASSWSQSGWLGTRPELKILKLLKIRKMFLFFLVSIRDDESFFITICNNPLSLSLSHFVQFHSDCSVIISDSLPSGLQLWASLYYRGLECKSKEVKNIGVTDKFLRLK